MPDYVLCPYCKATVQPLRSADGAPVCPVCHNSGTPLVPAQVAVARKPEVPGAIASLVCGITGVVTASFGIGIILGIIAIVLGRKAQRLAEEQEPGTYSGEGMAKAGWILGIIAIIVGVFSVAFTVGMFYFVANLADEFATPPDIAFSADASANRIEVVAVEPGLDWSEFTIEGSAGCALPSGTVDEGDVITCAGDGYVSLWHEGSARRLYETTV